MSQIKSSILETIGNTPIVKINKLGPKGVELFVKLEAFNPMGSVKDRLALGVIEAAERDGSLRPGQTIVEATSGNTGIGLAMVCAQKGYPLVVTMAESFSVERRKLMRFLGAKVVLTPAAQKGSGMVAKARELAAKHGWFMSRQFENPANVEIHSRTTAREILRDFGNDGLDFWVTGFGTGGTLTGVARVLRNESPETKIVTAEPATAALMQSGEVQPFNPDGSAAESHPAFNPHPMQGWSPDFISDIAHQSMQNGFIDQMVSVAGPDAISIAKDLARKEGIFCGISGGATFAAALHVAKTAPQGSKILAMLPDTGERYLSTPLFDDVAIEMTDEELALSESTPSVRFDVPAPAKPSPVAALAGN
ncbi:cysteine synthase A [Roseovarius rhodophyticola]|uniref:cysteine synthase n=1 Tax=Roseovarius rhodophyticola TaxID=3080827 RepID=A0ABZ2TJP4_9RHOB|nr:cysteine synthase A [Roseovarius sp. W115]MDV2930295.1 cysteine synthase A [Roseovarius sp. W115]